MSFKEKMLSKSNSYNYYKNEVKKLKKENNLLRQEVDDLKNRDFFSQFLEIYGMKLNFCYREYEQFYLSDEFEDKFKEICSVLPKESKYQFKWYFLRALVVILIQRPTLFLDSELEDQKHMDEIIKMNNEEFNFLYPVGFHTPNFNLTQKDMDFIWHKDIIDAGAYRGDTALPLSKLTNKTVWAFEPFEDSFEILKEHIKINEIKNIVPIKKSVGDTDGEKTLFLTGDDFSGITSKPEYRLDDDWDELKVEECSIDKFVEENDVNIGYINVDVEGGELNLLNGAINTIKSQKPILAISIYHQASDFFEIILWIKNLDIGYEFEIIKENPNYFLQETMVIARCND